MTMQTATREVLRGAPPTRAARRWQWRENLTAGTIVRLHTGRFTGKHGIGGQPKLTRVTYVYLRRARPSEIGGVPIYLRDNQWVILYNPRTEHMSKHRLATVFPENEGVLDCDTTDEGTTQ